MRACLSLNPLFQLPWVCLGGGVYVRVGGGNSAVTLLRWKSPNLDSPFLCRKTRGAEIWTDQERRVGDDFLLVVMKKWPVKIDTSTYACFAAVGVASPSSSCFCCSLFNDFTEMNQSLPHPPPTLFFLAFQCVWIWILDLFSHFKAQKYTQFAMVLNQTDLHLFWTEQAGPEAKCLYTPRFCILL